MTSSIGIKRTQGNVVGIVGARSLMRLGGVRATVSRSGGLGICGDVLVRVWIGTRRRRALSVGEEDRLQMLDQLVRLGGGEKRL